MTVIVALAGMFLGGTDIWTPIGIGTILVVAIAVAGSLTVLPAILSWLGDRVEKGRIRCSIASREPSGAAVLESRAEPGAAAPGRRGDRAASCSCWAARRAG